MIELKISAQHYSHLERISNFTMKEVCALIYTTDINDIHIINKIVQVRNTKRIKTSFGISKLEFQKHLADDLSGIYHTHFNDFELSENDKRIFTKFDIFTFQMIGIFNQSSRQLNLMCYSTKLTPIKIDQI
ncbi:MAG: hypothetical protein IPP01_04935 [Saprospiraceae bacterium]|nr:hypothetical protein [Saprospiraceae bacterium]